MSNLKILWPQVQVTCANWQSWQSFSDLRPANNLWGRERGHWAERAAASVDPMFLDFDMGAASTVQVDTLYLGQISYYYGSISTVRVQRAASVSAIPPSVGAGTDLYLNSSFTSATLTGVTRNRRGPEDFVATWSLSTAARCIRLWLTPVSSLSIFLSKAFICQAFDFNREVETYSPSLPQNRDARWESPGGQIYSARSLPQPYRFELVWRGVTNAKVTEFANIARYSNEISYALYNTGYTALLADVGVLNVKLIDWSSERTSEISDYNTVSAVFEECT
jgi:hypothetical protein